MRTIPWKIALIAGLILGGVSLLAQENPNEKIDELASISQPWYEGFQKNTGGNTFSYGSFRNDITESMITRCTDGKMSINWETAPLPSSIGQSTVGLLWMASMDLTDKKHTFSVWINDQKRFDIITSQKKQWSLTTSDGGKLSFVTVQTDQFGDASGYMYLEAPKSWIREGVAQKISIVGNAENDNCWIIVFQAPDALSYLQKSVRYNDWLKIELAETKKNLTGKIEGPFTMADKQLAIKAGNQTQTVMMKRVNSLTEAHFSLPLTAKNKPLRVTDSVGELFFTSSLGTEIKNTRLLNQAVLFNESQRKGATLYLSSQRSYNPKTVANLFELSNSNLNSGEILLMNSSHQDIAWMDAPEKCVIERDTMLLTPLFRKAEQDINYRFDLEDALMLKEFTERHPDKKALAAQLLGSGRLSCGSTYIQPYEEMYSGESLARQFYLGAKWLKKEFNYMPTVYWNEDVPGRTLQMSQLMRKAGTKYLMISRQKRGLFNWYSPDGSYVTTYSPGHYGDSFGPLQKNFHDAAQYLSVSSMEWGKYYKSASSSPIIPLLSDNDMSPAKDYSKLMESWSRIKELQNDKGEFVPVKLPAIKLALAPEFFDALTARQPDLPGIAGERPDVWLYIHGPSHYEALKASREADILLPVAEKLATINAMIDGSFRNYPQKQLTHAWEAKIYPDHGWGGKHGDITDDLFLSKYTFAKSEAEKMIDVNLDQLAAKIKTTANKGIPCMIVNTTNQTRNDWCSTSMKFDKSVAFDIQITDSKGKALKSQLSQIDRYEDGSIREVHIDMVAENVPPIGYTTVFARTLKTKPVNKPTKFNPVAENDYYKITFDNGGLSSIFDKQLQVELVNSSKFTAGEVFTMRSVGNGAGEFSDIQKPDMEGFDKTGNYPTQWEIVEDGPVFTTYKYRQHIRYADVEQRIKLFHQQKRIDFETALLNWEGVLYREFRMALPLNMKDGQVAYEVPFGVVEVGKSELEGAAGERYTTPCKEVHPRGIENWISASNSRFGVTMSSSVVVNDWIDPTDQPMDNQMIQPILLASRKSCHWEGNDYLQTGNHTYTFSLTSHPSGWQNGWIFGRMANEKLLVRQISNTYQNASLPESISFLRTDHENILISTVKKAEDSDEIVVRLVEMTGKNQSIHLQPFKKISGAYRTNLIEEEPKAVPFEGNSIPFSLGHHAIETLKFK